jgi:hypothetical protein
MASRALSSIAAKGPASPVGIPALQGREEVKKKVDHVVVVWSVGDVMAVLAIDVLRG